MTTIVATSEEDPALAVVRFTSELAWVDAGPEVAEPQVMRECIEAQECMVSLRWLDLASLMLTSADLVVPRVSDKDLECIFTVICNLVTKAGTPDEALEMAKLISAKVTQQPNDRPALRLKILFALYNLLDNPYSKFFVYTKALDLAVNGKVIENMIPSFKKLDSLLNEWNIGKMDRRELFLTISNILKDNKSMAKDSFAFLTKYLATFLSEDEETYVTSETKEEAVRAIIEFVKSADMFQALWTWDQFIGVTSSLMFKLVQLFKQVYVLLLKSMKEEACLQKAYTIIEAITCFNLHYGGIFLAYGGLLQRLERPIVSLKVFEHPHKLIGATLHAIEFVCI